MAEFKTKKLLTIPNLKLIENQPVHIRITSAMFVGKEIKSRRNAAPTTQREPATLVNAVNLDTGEECQVILSAIPKSTLTEGYPDDTYVGKCFRLTKLPRKEGKEYNGFKVEEIEDPAEAEAPPVGGKHKR